MTSAGSTRHLCYNCFQERPEGEGPCPYCGFDLEENVKKYPVALRAGTVLNGRYIIGRVLGQGGFGITYLAWDTKLEAKVAVKEFMPGELATRVDGTTVSVLAESKTEAFTYGAERFQEEARTLAKFMGQPNIAGVTDYFDENDTSYFVMDYIEGISFKTYIANHGGKVSVEEACNVMIPVLRALTAVHAEGFIHRDVTPDNIYITKDGVVKLLDFGSARYSIGDKSKSLDVILKVSYAPKEQYIRRSRQGPFTDVYSCAACFYAAITGYLPPESLERLDKDELVPISQLGIDIPEYLDKAILKGLAVQPEDRFQSAAEFLEAIESQQVVEVPASAAAVPPAPAKKKRTPLLIAGAAVLIAAVFALGALLGGGTGGGDASGGDPVTEALAPKVTIAGQEYSTALTELDLSHQELTDTDIQALAEMTSLQSLNLNETMISDLTPLAGLTHLKALYLGGNNALTDLSPLENLTELNELLLPAQAELSDLTPLSGMTQLRNLGMSDGVNDSLSKIEDIAPLSGLTQLEELTMAVRSLTDLSPLAGLTHLKTLRLYGAISISDLSPLSGMKALEVLQLTNNHANSYVGTDLNALQPLTHLKTIRLNVDGLTDLSPLAGLTELEELNMYGFEGTYSSLEPLRELTALRVLVLPRRSDAANRQHRCSLNLLAGFTDLEEVRLDGDTSDLSPLSGLTKLRTLTLYNGYLMTDLSPLSQLTNLQTLTIYGHADDLDYSPVSHVPNLILE